MSKIIKTEVFKYEELGDEAKDKAIEKLWDINVSDSFWYESIYEDAATIGLKITGFDIDRGAKIDGRFTQVPESVANAIMANHGETCDTYKDAAAYLKELAALPEDEDGDKDTEEIDEEFLRTIKEDYLSILRNEYEYLTSKDAIIEVLDINDYTFRADGTPFNG